MALTKTEKPEILVRAAELANVLASHNHKEERVLYPRGEAALDDNERAALLRRLMAF